jgi:predicted HicB family RNase H-like nuclease
MNSKYVNVKIKLEDNIRAIMYALCKEEGISVNIFVEQCVNEVVRAIIQAKADLEEQQNEQGK